MVNIGWWRLMIYRDSMISLLVLIVVGRGLLKAWISKLEYNMKKDLLLNKNNKGEKAFLIFSPKINSQLLATFESKVCISMVDQVQESLSFPRSFIITYRYRKRKKCIFTNLWQVFMPNCFYFKNKKKDLIPFQL